MAESRARAIEDVLLVAQVFLGQGEERAKGDNRGQIVEWWQKLAGTTPGAPWCAAFVSAVGLLALGRSGPFAWPLPLTAGCEAIYRWASVHRLLVPQPATGDVMLIHFPSLGRHAHTGFVLRATDGAIRTLEGNTNTDGSREGWVVAERERPRSPRLAFVRWANALPGS